MKKKITALVLAAITAASVTAFAETVNFESPQDTRAVIMCYDDNGALVYSAMCKSEDGNFEKEIPSEYEGMRTRVYYVGSKTFADITRDAAETEVPIATEAPAETVKPTSAPTTAPSKSYPSIYKREVDSIYAPALVKDVEMRINSNNEEIYAVTALYHDKEITVSIDADLTIATAPEEYSYMKGSSMNSLKAGDVIVMISNVAGDTIKTVDFIFRPTDEDIVTGGNDYGTGFEKLFSADGKVAGKWAVMKYGEKPSSDKYQYAFGIVARKDSGTLTLINKNASEDEAIELDIQPDTLVYSCDVDGREYLIEMADVNSIFTTLPKTIFTRDEPIVLDDEYSYNYALVRVVDGTATEIILYNNYNE